VAFALAGRIDCDLVSEPLGYDDQGRPVMLRELWPSPDAVREVLGTHAKAPAAQATVEPGIGARLWEALPSQTGPVFQWGTSEFLRPPPFALHLDRKPPGLAPIVGARALLVLGDSVTTDHISPGSAIDRDSDAGRYLIGCGVDPRALSTYIARRGNHEVMVRGTFANVRLRNRLVDMDGGYTRHADTGEVMSVHSAAEAYRQAGTPLVVVAGREYGTGSSRDWAAKGTQLLGVRAVIAQSFERIHRSNLVGMGVVPLELIDADVASLGLDGMEWFDLPTLDQDLSPGATTLVVIRPADRPSRRMTVRVRAETPIEIEYLRHGGILPFVARDLARGS